MVSKEQRRRELARAKLARQQARRESEAKRRQMAAIIAAGVAVLLVVGFVTWLSLRGDDTPVADPPATSAPETTPPTSTGPTETVEPPSGECQYRPTGDAAKDVTPPTDGPAPELASATATIETDQGVIQVDLDPGAAPCTVQSFLTLADSGYFDGTICHRLTTSKTLKVLQCGDPTGTGSGGPGYEFDDEVSPDLTYDRGTVAMANAGPGTNGSQFFLVYGDSKLDPAYTVFGTISGGLEVLDEIAEAGVSGGGSDGTPSTSVTLTSVTAETAS